MMFSLSCVGSVILSLIYGYEAAHRNDKLVHLADEAFRTVSWAILPGSYMVDYLLVLRHIPGLYSKDSQSCLNIFSS